MPTLAKSSDRIHGMSYKFGMGNSNPGDLEYYIKNDLLIWKTDEIGFILTPDSDRSCPICLVDLCICYRHRWFISCCIHFKYTWTRWANSLGTYLRCCSRATMSSRATWCWPSSARRCTTLASSSYSSGTSTGSILRDGKTQLKFSTMCSVGR